MRQSCLLLGIVAALCVSHVVAEDPYRFLTWTVTYGIRSPLGVPQQVILINDQFPGPTIDAVTNENIVLNLVNKLTDPFLLTWNGIKQRKNSWQDGVLGTNCPIPPGRNYTYSIQLKDQIGTFTYFPSTEFHKAAGGYGALNLIKRPQIPLPYNTPDGDFSFLIGDWFSTNHKVLQRLLDSGKRLPSPDGLLINGQRQVTVTGNPGKTYRLRFSNIGLATSLNVRIEGHKMKLVEVEGSHVLQTLYDNLDVHVGQSVTVLVTLSQPYRSYFIAVSTRFSNVSLTTTAILRYGNSNDQPSGKIPPPPSFGIDGSMNQARSIRWNLTANAARPNPQGSYHYGKIKITKSIVLRNTKGFISGKLRFTVNGVSYINPITPLKLADYFNIGGIFSMISLANTQSEPPRLGTTVFGANLHDFIEIVLQNDEDEMQSWHLDGYDFWMVGMDKGRWTPNSRVSYNLVDAVTRHTAQVFPRSWTTIMVSLDNQGMWNLRSAVWERQYLGQQFYIKVIGEKNPANENNIPANHLRCGRATE